MHLYTLSSVSVLDIEIGNVVGVPSVNVELVKVEYRCRELGLAGKNHLSFVRDGKAGVIRIYTLLHVQRGRVGDYVITAHSEWRTAERTEVRFVRPRLDAVHARLDAVAIAQVTPHAACVVVVGDNAPAVLCRGAIRIPQVVARERVARCRVAIDAHDARRVLDVLQVGDGVHLGRACLRRVEIETRLEAVEVLEVLVGALVREVSRFAHVLLHEHVHHAHVKEQCGRDAARRVEQDGVLARDILRALHRVDALLFEAVVNIDKNTPLKGCAARVNNRTGVESNLHLTLPLPS